MAEIDELRQKLTDIRTKSQQIADKLGVPYTAGEMTLLEIAGLLDDIKETSGGGVPAPICEDNITATDSVTVTVE